MLESILVYGVLMITMIICGKGAADRQCYVNVTECRYIPFCTPEIISILLLFSFIFGARYDVGIDYLSYLEIFQEVASGYLTREDLEPGFLFLTELFADNGFHYFFYFAFFAFLQVFFVFYTFRNERYLYPYLAFIIMSGVFLGWMNVMRQNTVVCVFIWMVHLASERKFIAYCLCVFVCSFFLHTTALLLLPVYFLLRLERNAFSNILLQLAGFAIIILLNLNSSVFSLFKDVNDIMNFIGYDDRFKNFNAEESTNDYSYGVRSLLSISIYITIILYSKRLKKVYLDTDFSLYYTLFYIGICMHTLFSGNHILQRPALYFIGMMLPVYAYLLHYLWHKRHIVLHKIVFLFVVTATLFKFILMVYIGQAEDCTLFRFFWQA